MNGQVVFFVIVSILAISYVSGVFLDRLNGLYRNMPIPDELSDIYDNEQYLKQQEYEKTKSSFGLFSGAFSFLSILAMLFLDGFATVDGWVSQVTVDPVLSALVFFGILLLASDFLTTPFDLYGTFIIEEKFGFNKTTPKTFVLDKIKGWLLGGVVGGGLLSVIIWFITLFPDLFWVYAWGAVATFMIFFTMFYSSLIVPLFNKQTPLADGELKEAIHAFSNRVGFKLDNIFVIDGSKRSTKANAYFSGLGAKKRIVLYDTLINDLTTDEIVAVLAHEVGHYKHKHTLAMIVLSVLQMGIMFYILSLFVSDVNLSVALGVDQPKIHIALIAFSILFSPISSAVGIAVNAFSRKNEYEADRYANEYSSGADLVSALKKLSKNNLSNLTPHPLYVFVNYSHPTLLQRMRNIGLAH